MSGSGSKFWIIIAGFMGGPVLAVFALLLMVTVMGGTGSDDASSVGPSELALADIPAEYLAIYKKAGVDYKTDWWVLAGIGKVETNHGRSNLPGVKSGVNSYGCCAGPMQFMVSRNAGCRTSCYADASKGTWEAYRVDGNKDGKLDVYDPNDAIPAAARYTNASGAPKNWERGLFAYNRSHAYYVEVMEWANKYKSATAITSLPPGGAFIWPVPPNYRSIISEFGPRWGRMHEGVDIPVPSGTPLFAAAGGRISYSGVMSGYGNVIDIDHGKGFSTRYAHQTRLISNLGDLVVQGQQIGVSGCTGRCFGPHLHFETRINGAAQNPRSYLPG